MSRAQAAGSHISGTAKACKALGSWGNRTSEASMLYVDLFESEAIAKFAYDLGTRRLVIFFKSGGVYEYQDVPRTVFDGFRAAQSKGEFFQSAIRTHFASQRFSTSEAQGTQ